MHSRSSRQDESQPDSLIMLLSVVRENALERQKLLEILDLDSLHRKMAVNFLVMQMRQDCAPEDFITAWDSLQDDAIAEQAKALIQDATLEKRADSWTVALIIASMAVLGGILAIFFWLLRNG